MYSLYGTKQNKILLFRELTELCCWFWTEGHPPWSIEGYNWHQICKELTKPGSIQIVVCVLQAEVQAFWICLQSHLECLQKVCHFSHFISSSKKKQMTNKWHCAENYSTSLTLIWHWESAQQYQASLYRDQPLVLQAACFCHLSCFSIKQAKCVILLISEHW